MKKALLILTGFTSILAAACNTGIDTGKLYGKWKYIKVGVPNSSPPDSVTRADLEENKPYIEIKTGNQFNIFWGGKLLSHGTFKISGKNLNMHELLPDGNTRDFPFFVSNLTDKQITFETVGAGGSQVTAIKE